MINKIKSAWSFFCNHNYRMPKYILITYDAYYELTKELSFYSNNPLDYEFNRLQYDYMMSKPYLEYYGMRIIVTEQIDSEFEIV